MNGNDGLHKFLVRTNDSLRKKSTIRPKELEHKKRRRKEDKKNREENPEKALKKEKLQFFLSVHRNQTR